MSEDTVTDAEREDFYRREAVGELANAAGIELLRALDKFPRFNSPHEGWAVIFEELHELWDHVKANTGTREDARDEAIQIAAMALRYALDLCGDTA